MLEKRKELIFYFGLVITIMTGVSSPYILGKQRLKNYNEETASAEFSELGIDIVRD